MMTTYAIHVWSAYQGMCIQDKLIATHVDEHTMYAYLIPAPPLSV